MKRVTIVAGHYGSGKTNFAVNYALEIAKSGKKTSLSDLDIVNPYFRSKDSEKVLADANIRFISSDFANSNVDVPAIPAAAYSVCADKESYAVVDVGGDDRGALALGRYVPEILAENNYEMLFVINCYRPLTRNAKSTVEVMHEIEDAAKIRFTGIVNNSNIGEETRAEDIIKSIGYANEVSRASGLPIVMTSIKAELYDELKNKIDNLLPMTLQAKPV